MVERGGRVIERELAAASAALSTSPGADATVQPPALAFTRDILSLVPAELAAAGVAGEDRVAKLLYLVVTSRLLARPCSVAIKGPSAGGKSFLVEQVLRLFPPSAYYALSAMSERALAYDREPLAHRMLVIYEAAGLNGEMATYLMRSLLSEGRISYVTVVKSKAGLEAKRIEREGPTGLITTTTAVKLHPENETRLLSLTVNDSPAQTRAVMLARAAGAAPVCDVEAWHALQTWVEGQQRAVDIPFAATLANAIPPVAVRLRRDFVTLLSLIAANALLHQAQRGRAVEQVVATFADYETVRGLVAEVFAEGAERSISATVRATVEAVAAADDADLIEEGVTVVALAKRLGLDKSSAWRRARVAIERGFLRNLEERRGRPARLVPAEPLPADKELLPSRAELERLHGCSADGGDIEPPVELAYPSSAWATDDAMGMKSS